MAEKDPTQHWGGLKKILTPEGHYLWLCEYHAQEYRRQRPTVDILFAF